MPKVGDLDSKMSLTLTIVTGSLHKTQLVSSFYRFIDGLSITYETDMHFKVTGNAELISKVFNTSFSEYKCKPDCGKDICYASNSKATLPDPLKSSVVGILGLENIITGNTNYAIGEINITIGDRRQESSSSIQYFKPPKVAQIYNFPDGDGLGVSIGIVTLGGYFKQTDLDKYFDIFSLGTAPYIEKKFLGGAQENNDVNGINENYLDIEIIASIVPKAKITIYFAPNDFGSFYEAVYFAVKENDVVSISWLFHETIFEDRSDVNVFEELLSKTNVPVFAATGDDGSSKGVSIPSTCPSAIGKLLIYIKKWQ